jgi:hypothetical protein
VTFATLPEITDASARMGADPTEALVSADFHVADVNNADITAVTIYYDTETIDEDDPSGAAHSETLTSGTGKGKFQNTGFEDALLPNLTPGETYHILIVIENEGECKAAYELLPLYKAADTTLNVTVPVKMIFAAFASKGGDIVSPEYHITTEAHFPVKVTLASFTAVSGKDEGLILTDETPIGNYFNLKFSGIDPNTFGTAWITPEAQTHFMGNLGSSYNTAELDGPHTASFEITGLYKGDLTGQKFPEYAAVFRFALEYEPAP